MYQGFCKDNVMKRTRIYIYNLTKHIYTVGLPSNEVQGVLLPLPAHSFPHSGMGFDPTLGRYTAPSTSIYVVGAWGGTNDTFSLTRTHETVI